ncbi:MAG: bifunctional diaminohydroxyphosphoribosylaminopyrimidine deaminase/5-amino-6-(5-phosphoribosylamino)uracil reductase RibD [Myxococcales bacterium]|nr:bifunctional diaminohydroxyphosphoribosylaminopyrimidine deaminase/5-amino-6-(5-phosphoribosylamino)uracil reductase RibD [Myxococcales bacterium]
MRRALSQARRASGRTHPNPPVGAIVYRGDRVLGRGCTRPIGGAHAEVVAIERAIRRHGARAVRGASLAVTLEPCSHTGRTAPCADRVIDAGLNLVLIGHRDPHAQVAGAGLRRLRRAGLRVEVGILEDECRQQHRGFLSVCERGRPFVSLKLASTLDGRIATAAGQSRWITGPEARAVVSRNAGEDAQRELSAMGLEVEEVLEKKGRFIIYRTPPGAEAMSRGPKLTANGEPVYPVVLNRRTGQLGVIPGQIVVRLKDASQAQSLADDFGVGLLTVFQHLNTASYQVAFEQDEVPVEQQGLDVGRGAVDVPDDRPVAVLVEISSFDRPGDRHAAGGLALA